MNIVFEYPGKPVSFWWNVLLRKTMQPQHTAGVHRWSCYTLRLPLRPRRRQAASGGDGGYRPAFTTAIRGESFQGESRDLTFCEEHLPEPSLRGSSGALLHLNAADERVLQEGGVRDTTFTCIQDYNTDRAHLSQYLYECRC